MHWLTEKFWFAWSMTAVLGLLLIGSGALGQSGPALDRNWMQVTPRELTRENRGVVFRGPLLEPGMYMVWVAAKEGDGSVPYRVWRAHGPFEAVAGQTYLVTVQGGGIPAATWKAWSVLDAKEGPLASVHYLNQLSEDASYGITIVPMNGSAPRMAALDALSSTDPPEPRHQSPHKVYPVRLNQGKTYVLEMKTQDFDTYLMVENERGELLAQNDAQSTVLTSRGLNSRITFQPPASGTYRLIASAFSATAEGNFAVKVREVPVLMQVEDRLTKEDMVRNACYCKEYEVMLTAGRRYYFSLESGDFGTCMKLLNAEGMIVAFDEGGGMDNNTRIAYQPTATGRYRIVATSFTEHSTGAFALSVREDE